MAYGFNDDKTTVTVPTMSQFAQLNSAGFRIYKKTITVRTAANNWKATAVTGFPATTQVVIPVLKSGVSPTNPSTIWANGISVYVKDGNTPSEKVIVVASTRSDQIDVTIDLIALCTGIL